MELLSKLSVSNITAGYGETAILNNISIEITAHEMVTIIGPNGSGKSTLLKTIIGLIKPSSGNIILDNIDITGLPPQKIVQAGIGYVPQTNNVFESLTVKDNIELGCSVGHVNRKEATGRIFNLFPQLEGLNNRPAGQLSGGQRQIVAFAKALVLEPTLLILDEPLAGLSPIIRGVVLETITTIHKSGLTILIVEQNARQILPLSDRGYVLVAGKKKLEGVGKELLENPEVAELYLGGGKLKNYDP